LVPPLCDRRRSRIGPPFVTSLVKDMRHLAFMIALVAHLATVHLLSADEPVPESATAKAPAGGESEQAAERQRRTDFMKTLVGRHIIVAADAQAPLALADEPFLRYTNPVRNFFTDGAVFLWLEHKRPLAAGSPTIRGTGQVFVEFSSLTGRPLECRRENVVVWAPKTGSLVEQPLDAVPPPGASDKVRLRQMRDAARRFHVLTKSEPDVELRLMAQPIYRYAAERDGVIDGAVFAFVEATDPDFLLVVEAHQERATSPAEWRYTLARLCSRPVEASLDGKPLWSGAGYWTNPRSVSDPYAEKLMGSYPPPSGKKPKL
ncbi:MAG: hypothetical protein ACREHD_18945, partial [Pirellulales bacterium]